MEQLQYFSDEEFMMKMSTEVTKLFTQKLVDDYIKNEEGILLHYNYMIHPKERAAVVISHGFCEFFGKYHEMAYYFYQQGYSVFFMEHRGHGWSDRLTPEQDMIYVKSYKDYVADLKLFMDEVVTKESTSKHYYLMAHSMGGAIGALFLEEHPTYFHKAVLSSPLMRMHYGSSPELMAKLITKMNILTKKDQKYVMGQHGFDGVYAFEKSSLLSKPRYDYMFDLRQKNKQCQTYGASYGWIHASEKATKRLVHNAKKVACPVLLFQAGRDTRVRPEGQDLFVKKCHMATQISFPQSKHEIFNATPNIRKNYYNAIFQFLEE